MKKIINIIILLLTAGTAILILVVIAVLYFYPFITSPDYRFLKFSIPKYSLSEYFAVHRPNAFAGSGPYIDFVTKDSCGDIFSFYEDELGYKGMMLLGKDEYGDLSEEKIESNKGWEVYIVESGYQIHKWQDEDWFIYLRCKEHFNKFKGLFSVTKTSK